MRNQNKAEGENYRYIGKEIQKKPPSTLDTQNFTDVMEKSNFTGITEVS
jgi:hypothetical protein